ncbi:MULTISPECIES: flagellar hook assembly protein FlgD [Rhizobium]|uniref:Basal-body rod modification protein FlgD n=1 Tax=Rhizobium sophoriradicis TaxID=1535245 RepID=A0A2A5KRK8_9HYPH|nr:MULTISPECIES: flagellar hook assembly protein FlgD [Rhizobium]AJC77960.1 flagellar basal body rod modification protein FlgD [Rhizobium etli bv. phaseoli str. IE4803]UWU35047.1 flagellar hook assembly protein FlgD [Rhizobium leguminosarum bv. phaseoli]ARQ56817.1 flagellar basal body rod modification protein FlgD [Rhizobium sp. Kim5]PCK79601.1 flagellar biosynthesis protein FlgD [Rhizobium sophoriradicis]PCK88785.1 flagellar biosynthesis protein FlgD [Rhizobium sophoriradicis]
MAVDATSSVSTSTTSSTSSAQKKATLNYDNFLQLLIAQMKNQDPTDPMDASEQMSQLASFSQVEQTIQTNTKLDTLLSSSSLTQASSYVGKYMESADGTVKGTVESVKVYSDGIIATTTDGGKILVQAGITVADKAPTTTTTTSDSSDT